MLVTWSFRATRSVSSLDITPNDLLGRSNAHHLEFRHRGPSPSKGSALRAASSLLKFSRWPFTGPRLARPCARTSRTDVRNESGRKLSLRPRETIGYCG